MADEVRDIWFRSTLPLVENARRLGLEDVTEDCEDHWAWAIGGLGDVKLDITRTHTHRPWQVDTKIFVLNDSGDSLCPFSESMIAEIVPRLRTFVRGSVFCGRWEYLSVDDFELVVIREFKPSSI